MDLKRRLKRLEERAPSPPAGITAGQQEALEEYFAVLAGEEVEERHDPVLEAYFEELEEQQAAIERRRRGA
ncbi:MAG: hypothetical protein M3N10_08780 [Actinomycetota bacterium]|nr:hypothetical protein [Actinomycetota bacterium]